MSDENREDRRECIRNGLVAVNTLTHDLSGELDRTISLFTRNGGTGKLNVEDWTRLRSIAEALSVEIDKVDEVAFGVSRRESNRG